MNPETAIASQPPFMQSAAARRTEPYSFDDVPTLTTALKRVDDTAYLWLHHQWNRRISRYCFVLAAGDGGLAEEIAQAAWLRLAKHARVLKDESTLWNWIALAARHAARDLWRRRSRYHRVLECLRLSSGGEENETTASGEGDMLEALDCALDTLTADESSLIEARYFSKEPLEDIGARLCLSACAVEGRLARLRVRLRERISHHLQEKIQ